MENGGKKVLAARRHPLPRSILKGGIHMEEPGLTIERPIRPEMPLRESLKGCF